jgi:hypothetical protein
MIRFRLVRKKRIRKVMDSREKAKEKRLRLILIMKITLRTSRRILRKMRHRRAT